MEFLDLVKTNRSYRGYDQYHKVSREELETLVNFARLTPSSTNAQTLKYFLSFDPETNAKIQPLTGWAKRLPHLKLPREGHNPTAFIVICFDKNLGTSSDYFMKDVGIVAQTMLLGAVGIGLGGIMIGSFGPKRISEALSLPEHLEPVLIVAIGKPDEEVKLVDVPENGEISYSRDENHVTFVPKRSLQEVIINK
jgi:nitroreductase